MTTVHAPPTEAMIQCTAFTTEDGISGLASLIELDAGCHPAVFIRTMEASLGRPASRRATAGKAATTRWVSNDAS